MRDHEDQFCADNCVEFFAKNEAGIRKLARRLARDQQEAEDLAQEFWLAFLRNPPQVLRSFEGWAMTRLRGLFQHKLRSERRRKKHEKLAGENYDAQAGLPVVGNPELQNFAIDLLGCIDKLKEPKRDCIRLVYFEDWSHADVASKFGIAIETVRTRLSRGRDDLRELLALEHDNRKRRALCLFAGLDIAILGKPKVTYAQKTGWFHASLVAAVLVVATYGFYQFVAFEDDESLRVAEGELAKTDDVATPREEAQPRRSQPLDSAKSSSSSSGGSSRSQSGIQFRLDAPHPQDASGRFDLADYIMVNREVGFAMVLEPRAEMKWRQEHWQLAAFRLRSDGSKSDVQLVDALNHAGDRSWVSVSLYSQGIVACFASTGGNFEAMRIPVTKGNLESAKMPEKPFLKGAINPKTRQPRSITYAKILEEGETPRAVLYITDGVIMAAAIDADNRVLPPISLDFCAQVPGALCVTGVRAKVFGETVEAFVSMKMESGTEVGKFEAPLARACESGAWVFRQVVPGGLRPLEGESSPSPLSWLWRMREGL